MNFETRCLEIVKSVTNVGATFFNGTLFLATQDSKIATDVFFKLCDEVTPAISYGKYGSYETSYDFLANRA